MKTSTFKRGMSLCLALLLCFSMLIFETPKAYAIGESQKVCILVYPRDGDAMYDTSGSWGHPALTFKNGWHCGSSLFTLLHTVGSLSGPICYCIEPGAPIVIGNMLSSRDESYWDNYPSEYNDILSPDDIKILIGRVMQYGYTGTIGVDWMTQNAGADSLAWALATQVLIWEAVVGERDADFNYVDPSPYSAVSERIAYNHPLCSKIFSYYDDMVNSVKNHTKIPSFMARSTGRAQTVELTWDGSAYSVTLTDTNNVLSNYSFTANQSGIRFSVSGNKLTITADTAPSGPVTVTASKNNSQRRGIITWSDSSLGPNSSLQDMVTYTQSVSDPVTGYLTLEVSAGSAKIVKTSEDGKVEGVSFTITGNGINQTVKTGPNGEVQIDNLAPGNYTVTELTENRYETQESRRVTVVSGQTATVTFNNVLKRGDLTVTKTSEDGLVEGLTFHLYGTSLSGQKVDEYATTDSSGKAYFEDVLIGTGYTLEETGVPDRYVIPDTQTAAVEWSKVTEKTFENVLKKWRATVTKSDSETGAAQGGASLGGAVYGVFKAEELVDSYTTDANGKFTTDYYPCGSDWTIRELSPSEGYLLDSTFYPVGAEARDYTLVHNDLTMAVQEKIVKAKIAIIKHTDDGETQLETPEVGAKFEVYLKSAGSYEAAKESERDILICDENGFAETKSLPYGVYIVHQTSGWDGRELLPDFDVYVAKDGETYRYLANNAGFESYIKIVKVDAETGKTIPSAGTGFQIYDPEGNLVTMTFTYPEFVTTDTFYTNNEGYLITPESLEYGTGYSLVEVQAPYGYVLNSDPIYFDVTADNATTEGGITLVEVVKNDAPQKGVIKISKTGEVFATVVSTDEIYQPVYEVQGLPGAVYEIRASEDIYTSDGTLRYAAGDLVDTLTTGPDGSAESKPLYLGKYSVFETEAPYGMVLNMEVRVVELIYAGQEIEITETTASFYNERQKAALSLNKVMEQNGTYSIGTNDELSAVTFGLFAAEELTAADGTVIPKDGLLEIVSVDANGHALCKTDLPLGSFYLKELSTDSHYLMSDEQYPVDFEYAGQGTALVEIRANNGEAIKNELISGKIQGLKKDNHGEGLGGALIGLYPADTHDFTIGTALIAATSDEDGSFSFDKVPYGDWILHEIKAPSGYALSDVSYPVTVNENGAVIEIEIENESIRGSVRLTKVDKDYPEHKLTGAEFAVYEASNGNKELDKDDKKLGLMAEVSIGIYEMSELPFGGYFVREEKAPEGFYPDGNAYYFEITKPNEMVTVEN